MGSERMAILDLMAEVWMVAEELEGIACNCCGTDEHTDELAARLKEALARIPMGTEADGPPDG